MQREKWPGSSFDYKTNTYHFLHSGSYNSNQQSNVNNLDCVYIITLDTILTNIYLHLFRFCNIFFLTFFTPSSTPPSNSNVLHSCLPLSKFCHTFFHTCFHTSTQYILTLCTSSEYSVLHVMLIHQHIYCKGNFGNTLTVHVIFLIVSALKTNTTNNYTADVTI